MELEKTKRVYFVGIGGIGMSAIARFFNHRKAEVFGHDRVATTLTQQLEQEGMNINYIDEVENIPKEIDLVVYTPAIPKDHKQLNHFLSNNYEVKKRSEVLQILSSDKFTIAIAGSHGKTTVATMIAHILKASGCDCTAFLGGISINYNSNYLNGDGEIMVIEADEFDRSFHRLLPDIAVVTAIDTDHLDVYGSVVNIENAFSEFISRIKKDGVLIANAHLPINNKLKDRKELTYSLSDSAANYYVSFVSIRDGNYQFAVQSDHQFEAVLKMGETFSFVSFKIHNILTNRISGFHNVMRRKESLHAIVGHTKFFSPVGQQFISHSGIRILLLH